MHLVLLSWLAFAASMTLPSANSISPAEKRFHARLSLGYTGWQAVEAGHVGILYDLEKQSLRLDGVWMLDPWLCEVEGATGSHCRAQRWEIRFGPEFSMSKRFRFSPQVGGYHRWGVDRMPHPTISENSLDVLRTEKGLSISPGILFRAQPSPRLAWGIELTPAILVPMSERYRHTDYPLTFAIFEPRVAVVMEFSP